MQPDARQATGSAMDKAGFQVLPISRHPEAAIDVLIVGCGPVGATLGVLLGDLGVSVRVIDSAQTIHEAPRAIALDNEALRILQQAGIGETDFECIAIPQVRMRSPMFGVFARIDTTGTLDGHPKLVTFYQPDLERALRRRLVLQKTVQMTLGLSLTDLQQDSDGVNVSVLDANGLPSWLRARYVIGADGAGSMVRKLIGQDFHGRSFGEDWLIIDALDVPHPIDHVEFVCDPKRPTPHMVAPGGRERWEFMLRPGESADMMTDDARIHALLAEWGCPPEVKIERKAVYRFHARVVERFRMGRVFLVGDAAHITPPFAGQGLVAGLRDCANLAWKLAWVLRGHADEAVLDSYNTERRPHARAMIALARLMGRLVMPMNAMTAFFSHGSIRIARLFPVLRRQLEDQSAKPKNVFAKGLFVRGAKRSGLLRGGLLPQGWIRAVDGRIELSDEALGNALTLIGFGTDIVLEAEVSAVFAAAGGQVVQICHRGQALHLSAHDAVWEDIDGSFLSKVVPVGWAAVVRPDRIVLNDGPVDEASRLVRESLRILGSPDPLAAPSRAASTPNCRPSRKSA